MPESISSHLIVHLSHLPHHDFAQFPLDACGVFRSFALIIAQYEKQHIFVSAYTHYYDEMRFMKCQLKRDS